MKQVFASSIYTSTIRFIELSEAVVRRCSVKKVFLEISQNSQENTCARVSFEFCEISKNTFFHRSPLVAASELCSFAIVKMLLRYLNSFFWCGLNTIQENIRKQQ